MQDPEIEFASSVLQSLITEARKTHDRNLIRRLRRLWSEDGRTRHGEKWRSIVKKVDCDDSTWVVWWNDGVQQLVRRPWY